MWCWLEFWKLLLHQWRRDGDPNTIWSKIGTDLSRPSSSSSRCHGSTVVYGDYRRCLNDVTMVYYGSEMPYNWKDERYQVPGTSKKSPSTSTTTCSIQVAARTKPIPRSHPSLEQNRCNKHALVEVLPCILSSFHKNRARRAKATCSHWLRRALTFTIPGVPMRASKCQTPMPVSCQSLSGSLVVAPTLFLTLDSPSHCQRVLLRARYKHCCEKPIILQRIISISVMEEYMQAMHLLIKSVSDRRW